MRIVKVCRVFCSELDTLDHVTGAMTFLFIMV